MDQITTQPSGIGHNSDHLFKGVPATHILKYIPIEQLKLLGNTHMKNVKIILFDQLTIVTDPYEQKMLVEIYNIDPIVGGHAGAKRLSA